MVISCSPRVKGALLTALRARRCYCIHWHPTNNPQTPALRHSQDSTCLATRLRDCQQIRHHPTEYSSLLPEELLDILASFQMIDVYHESSGSSAKLLRSDAIYEAEYALIQLYDDDLIRTLEFPWLSANTSGLFHIAAHIYILIILRQILRRFSVVQFFAQRLESSLLYLRATLPAQNVASGLMLWIETLHCLSTLSIPAKNEGSRSVFAICDALNISKLRDFRNKLREVCWIDGVLGDDIVDLWNMRERQLQNTT